MCIHSRRADYVEWTTSEQFPSSFSGTRWLEDAQVAQRAIDIWENLSTYVDKVESKSASNRPKCASYSTVVRAVKTDPMTIAKLYFFIRVAKIMKPFLHKFQTSNPMMPFMEQELTIVMKHLLENIVKAGRLGTSPTLGEMFALDLEREDNLIDCKNICIGLATKEALLKLKLSEAKNREFKSPCKDAYKSIVASLKKRFSSSSIELFSCFSSLNPRFIVAHPHQSITRFESLVIYLVQKKLVKADEGDAIITQFKEFSRKIRHERKHESEHYSPTKDSIDVFFNELIGPNTEFNSKYRIFLGSTMTDTRLSSLID